MFWPVRELSILFVNTLTCAKDCGDPTRPDMRANIATKTEPVNFGRRSEGMRAPFRTTRIRVSEPIGIRQTSRGLIDCRQRRGELAGAQNIGRNRVTIFGPPSSNVNDESSCILERRVPCGKRSLSSPSPALRLRARLSLTPLRQLRRLAARKSRQPL